LGSALLAPEPRANSKTRLIKKSDLPDIAYSFAKKQRAFLNNSKPHAITNTKLIYQAL